MVNTNSVAAVQRQMYSPSQYWANSFTNNTLIDGDDSCMGIAPIGGQAFINAGSSVFGQYPGFGGANGFNSPYGMGMSPYGMMGYGPGSEVYGMTMKQYNNYQKDLGNQQIDNQVDYKHKIMASGFQANAAQNTLARQIAVLGTKLADNEQDQVMPEYNRCLKLAEKELVTSGYVQGKPDKEQVKAYFEQRYLETTGISLADHLKQSDHSPFLKGMMDGVGFGAGSLFTNRKTAGENYSEINNTPVSETEKTWQKVGWGTSAALTGGLGIMGVLKLIKKIRG